MQALATSFLRLCQQLSPWQEVGLEMERLELVMGVRQDFLTAQWLSLPFQGWGLIPSGQSRSPEGCTQAGSVPFKCVFSCSSHQDFTPEEWSDEASGPMCIQKSDVLPVQASVALLRHSPLLSLFNDHGCPRSSAALQCGLSRLEHSLNLGQIMQ